MSDFLMMLKVCMLPLYGLQKGRGAGPPTSLGRSRTLVSNLVPSPGEAGGKANQQLFPPHPGCGVHSRQATSSTGRDSALPCQGPSLLPYNFVPNTGPGSQGVRQASPHPHPHLPCHLRFSRDGHTDAEDAVRAPGTRGSLAIARGPSHSRLSSCQRTEPTCQAQPLLRAQLYSQRSVRARAPETPPAQQSPAHVQAARQSAAGAIS